jgi:hypothetical protein
MTDPVDELYGLPLEQFTDARNKLVRRLQESGDKENATVVRSLRKPSLAAWAVNQLARRHPVELRELMDLRDQIASGDAAAIRAASVEQRQLVSSLTERAQPILEEGGRSPGRATLDAVSRTLLAGGDEEERELILSGRLIRELAPSGFEGLPALATGVSDEGDEVSDPGSPAARRAEDLSKAAEEAEREAARLEVQADTAHREAESLARSAVRARVRAEEARARADDALDAL